MTSKEINFQWILACVVIHHCLVRQAKARQRYRIHYALRYLMRVGEVERVGRGKYAIKRKP